MSPQHSAAQRSRPPRGGTRPRARKPDKAGTRNAPGRQPLPILNRSVISGTYIERYDRRRSQSADGSGGFGPLAGSA